jgi:hypothetical protein
MLSDIISLEDQYEVAKARAEISYLTNVICPAVAHLVEYLEYPYRIPRPIRR